MDFLKPPKWMERANCRYSPTTFVPSNKPGRGVPPPLECMDCPVQQECLAYGVKTRSEGWFGGVYLQDTTATPNEEVGLSPRGY